ncbi:outer membrane protein assembly factor BamE [Bacillus timonensis]|nr:outer membrane protein assembly factor BamE [Bacillus timonensis]
MRFIKFLIVILPILLLVACGQEPNHEGKKGIEQTEKKQGSSSSGKQTENDNEEETTDKHDEETHEGEEGPSVTITIEPFTELFDVNGISIGDTREHVKEVLGEPIETYPNDARYDYTFQDAWYSEKLIVVFDDLGITNIEVSTATEKGILLTEDFIQTFSGDIYQATEQLAIESDMLSLFAYVLNSDSILVIGKYEDENGQLQRSYMIAPDYAWTFARGWDMETFNDESQFQKVDAQTAIEGQ